MIDSALIVQVFLHILIMMLSVCMYLCVTMIIGCIIHNADVTQTFMTFSLSPLYDMYSLHFSSDQRNGKCLIAVVVVVVDDTVVVKSLDTLCLWKSVSVQY